MLPWFVNLAAIITHRSFEMEGAELVRRFRDADPVVPIIMVSGVDRSAAAREAGATAFLHYDEWLRIGSVVEKHMRGADAAPASDEACADFAAINSFTTVPIISHRS